MCTRPNTHQTQMTTRSIIRTQDAPELGGWEKIRQTVCCAQKLDQGASEINYSWRFQCLGAPRKHCPGETSQLPKRNERCNPFCCTNKANATYQRPSLPIESWVSVSHQRAICLDANGRTELDDFSATFDWRFGGADSVFSRRSV